ncbi:hypothetical protein BU24DRAFT_430333 [Aaosphaeria arxii CBS 175.79]|uniref:DNA ligase D 3'-phosphoesterase domain-containing protein n=1 Tax=Aaosphaeria arxii CBS 175.79 TaxID=1450172 RepID=A0A6A5YAP2_9PLEO|nr:uncharacterized protein BU24DRAFT_430333 [Aaosphaeria arxii CBS 175.79]KAF2021791.1 hypothetical protein BU24DRAFT_430333 [Aaosphaeria arxii CBS 175.79]
MNILSLKPSSSGVRVSLISTSSGLGVATKDISGNVHLHTPSSLSREVSPPRLSKRRKYYQRPSLPYKKEGSPNESNTEPALAAVEAGKARVRDHVVYFSTHLQAVAKPVDRGIPRLSIEDFVQLYRNNEHGHGNHFVVHQHNHPRAGVHYDLRLQFSESSSVSFSIPKGLPGNPNSRSIGRMAIETRVHNLWNHLIESASSRTGSLLIWDTGTYTVLPRKIKAYTKAPTRQTTDDESEAGIKIEGEWRHRQEHENEKLIEAFQTRYIRLRLHGRRLPSNYTVTLRLPTANHVRTQMTSSPAFRPRRTKRKRTRQSTYTTDSEPENAGHEGKEECKEAGMDTDDEGEIRTRINNAYPGSTNSIGSIHQRQWFLSLDRASSGFVKNSDGIWMQDEERGGFEPFLVQGRGVERSVITGRLAAEVESDEGVEGFVGRAGWVGITN